MEGTCSIDMEEGAVVSCACAFPLPTLCEACKEKHCAGPGFHFLLPLSAVQAISSQRQLMQLQPRLLQLSNTYKEAYGLLPEIDRCADLIESVYQELLHFAEELKVQYQEKLSMLKQGYMEAVNKAVQETCQHAFEGQTYVPEGPIARLLWEDDPNRSSSLVKFEASAKCVRSHLNKAFQVTFRSSLPSLEHLNECTFPTPVQLTFQGPNDKIYSVDIQSSETVKSFKQKIEAISNIPTECQELSLELRLSNDEDSLSDLHLKDISRLNVATIPIPIFVTLPNAETISLSVGYSDTIGSVKKKVTDKKAILPALYQLQFSNQVLEHTQTIAYYNISKSCTLHLTPVSAPEPLFYQIFVKTPTGRTSTLEISNSDSIASVKERIRDKEGIPIEHYQLIFAGKRLEDEKTVKDYGLQGGSTIYIAMTSVRKIANPLEIYVNVRPGLTLILNCDSSDRVEVLKAKILEKTGIQHYMQRLTFEGNLLEDGRTLADYSIAKQSTLQLT